MWGGLGLGIAALYRDVHGISNHDAHTRFYGTNVRQAFGLIANEMHGANLQSASALYVPLLLLS